MWRSRAFQVAFILSLLVHTTIMLHHCRFADFSPKSKEDKLQVRYLKDLPVKEHDLKKIPKEEPFFKLPPKSSFDQKLDLPRIGKDEAPGKGRQLVADLPSITRPALIKPDVIAIKKKITLPPVGVEKIDNPSYLHYYQIVREKIKRQAYRNYTRTETGEVYLSFIVSCDGTLEEIRVTREKSSQSAYLKETAVLSVRDASPFPVFPKSLNYPRLSFNAVISFEVE